MTATSLVLSTFDIDSILRRIAQPQLGLVTVAEATAKGVDGCALARRRMSGALVPMFAEVMRLSPVASTPNQHILAASLAVPSSTIGALSAAVVHQMPVQAATWVDEPPTIVVQACRSARTAGIAVIRSSHQLPSRRW